MTVKFKRPDRVNGGTISYEYPVTANISPERAEWIIKVKFPDATEVKADGAKA